MHWLIFKVVVLVEMKLKAECIYRGSNICAHVLLNLLNELRVRDKMQGLPSIFSFFTTSLVNSIIQEHEC